MDQKFMSIAPLLALTIALVASAPPASAQGVSGSPSEERTALAQAAVDAMDRAFVEEDADALRDLLTEDFRVRFVGFSGRDSVRELDRDGFVDLIRGDAPAIERSLISAEEVGDGSHVSMSYSVVNRGTKEGKSLVAQTRETIFVRLEPAVEIIQMVVGLVATGASESQE